MVVYEKAKGEVKGINTKDMNELKMLIKPPQGIVIVFQALLKMINKSK